MKALESIIPQNLAEAVGTTFMHAIWQLAAVALLLLLVYQFVPRKSSRLRYNLGITALALMFILPLATFGLYFQAESQQVSIAPDTQTLLATGQYEQLTSILAAQDSQMAFLPGVTAFFSDNANLLFAIWALGAFLFTLRFLGSYLYVQRLRHRDTSPVPQAVMDSLLKLKEKLGIHRTIQLLQSAAVDTPMVIGVLRPVILLPIGLLSGLSPEQVQCILAHELAHIRRWDYLINIFQSIVEICLFFHPATWWVSKMVREERENCCDETVLALKNNNLVYAKALLNLEVLRTRKPNLAMTSNGGSLFKRIKRITGAEIRETRIYSKSLFVGLLTLTFILLLSTTGTDEIKASSPLSISGAPELAWELQPPSSATKSDKVTQPNTLLTPPSHPALPKVVTPDPQENPTPLFPVSTFLSHAKTIVQQAARNEVVAATATLGNISEEVGKEFSRDLLQFVAEQIAYAQDSPVSKIVLLENGEEIVIAIDVNGEVESVEVDGNPVAKSEYPKYKDMASGTVHNYLRANHRTPPPAPPAMPVPPMPNPGNIGSVPTPPHIMRNLPPTPQPPKPGTFPSPPSPPAKANMSDAEYEKAMEKYEGKMEHWGEKMESSLNQTDWEKFGEEMEEWGEKIAQQFESKDWKRFEKDMEAWGERFADRFESEEWEEFGEKMEEWGEKFGQRMEAWGEKLEAEIEHNIAHSKHKQERNRASAQAHQSENRARRYKSGIENVYYSLKNDGLLKNGQSYKLRINEDKLFINGKRQSSSMHRKYKHLVEKALDIRVEDEWVEINQDKSSTKSKTKIHR